MTRNLAIPDQSTADAADQPPTRVSFITLAVADLAATRRFYVDGLSWEPALEQEEVLMFNVAEKVVLSLWVEREWGGYTGYFADPDGFRWEVACNPGPIGLSVL